MSFKDNLNIFFVLDKNFIIPLTVSLTSIFQNNQDLQISVYVIHDIDNVSTIDSIVDFFYNTYSVLVNFITIAQNKFSDIPNYFPGSNYISKAAYFRLLLGDLLPSTVMCGLYLDCDTIVTGKLNELINLKFTSEENFEYSILAVEDNKQNINIDRIYDLGVDLDYYFNSGVMLVNLKRWRLINASDGLMKILEKFKNDLKWLDQDVLNIYFKNDVGKLNAYFNIITSKRLPITPLVIHFSGESKPWHYINNGPYKYLYLKYLKMTTYKAYESETITFKKVKRKYIEKVKKAFGLES